MTQTRKIKKTQARKLINSLNLLLIWRSFASETENALKVDAYDTRIEGHLQDARLYGLSLFINEETGMYNLKEESKNLSMPSFSDIIFDKISTILTDKINETNLKILELHRDANLNVLKTRSQKTFEELKEEKVRLNTLEEIKRDIVLLFYPQN